MTRPCPLCGKRVRVTKRGVYAIHASHYGTECVSSGTEPPRGHSGGNGEPQ